ncbi:hypothetical protein BDA96_02G280000 [Sorghum bicolor]|uniref:Uncharacterized protein n=2 Tax=Sorghum bicolor TaxID=4558 RepID=A0A921UWS0_SORBI|nr:hypothetical protein BDA96_02G280000 [Sorghum bicolor]OQU89781.1 hypothetical protein SORBI_3002G266250 [Sorghum bicolor]
MPMRLNGQIVRVDDSFGFGVLFRSPWPPYGTNVFFLQFLFFVLCLHAIPSPSVAVSIWRFGRGTLCQIQK